MALRINYNFESISAQRNLSQTQSSFFKAIEQLSSGMRINKAADDAAGLAVSEKLKNQVRGLNQAQRNAQDAISLMQVAEGALNETHNLLARMRELSIQSANDTLTDPDRKHLQAEMDQLLAEVDRIASSSQFNGKSLLVGTSASQTSLVFHIGANTGDEVSVSLSALDARAVPGRPIELSVIRDGAPLSIAVTPVRTGPYTTDAVVLRGTMDCMPCLAKTPAPTPAGNTEPKH